MTREAKHESWQDQVGRRDFDRPYGVDPVYRGAESENSVASPPTAYVTRGKEIQRSPSVKRIQQHLTVSQLHQRQQPIVPDNGQRTLPPLPATSATRRYGATISFILCVILPIAFAAVYYGFMASSQYVSEFRFSVKDTSTGASTGTGSSGVLAAVGITGMGTENYLVTDYLTSRQAVEDLQTRVKLIELYSKPEIDRLSRFDSLQPMEEFVRYWQKMVSTNYDQVTGIATAKVRAFTPQDALLVANTMVTLSEELVNEIGSRSRSDAVRFAEKEVEKAQDRVRRVRTQLTENQSRATSGGDRVASGNSSLLLDLERQVAQSMLASAMQTFDLARANAAAQHLYITPYVRPSLPQSSTYPRTLLSVATVGALAFAIWLAGLLTARSIFERF